MTVNFGSYDFDKDFESFSLDQNLGKTFQKILNHL